MKRLMLFLLGLLLTSAAVQAGVSLTVYQRNIVLVHDIRTVDLSRGENSIVLGDIAPGIFEPTLRVDPLKHASQLKTIELSYEYDLADQDRIWRKHLGKPFSFTKKDSLYEGILLRLDDDFIYLEPKGKPGSVSLIKRSDIADMTFDALPTGLVLHPEVRWKVNTDRKYSNLDVDVSYLAEGMTWEADYTALMGKNGHVNLQGSLVLTNSLDKDFEDASLALIAGDVHRSYDHRQLTGEDDFGQVTAEPEKNTRFFEYRRYKVPETTTLHANQTKNLPLIGPVDITAKKDFLFDGSAGTGEVMIRLSFANDEASGLGIGLPEGDLLLYKMDGDVAQFLGEDHLEASNPGDKVELLIGKAFDIRADRRRMSHQRIARNRTRDIVETTFISSRTKTSNITVRERLYGFWEITEATWNGKPVDYRVEHANKVEFDLELAPGRSDTLRYVVEYGY